MHKRNLDNGGNPYPETLHSANSTETKRRVTVTKVRVIEDPNNLTLGKWQETVNFMMIKEEWYRYKALIIKEAMILLPTVMTLPAKL